MGVKGGGGVDREVDQSKSNEFYLRHEDPSNRAPGCKDQSSFFGGCDETTKEIVAERVLARALAGECDSA